MYSFNMKMLQWIVFIIMLLPDLVLPDAEGVSLKVGLPDMFNVVFFTPVFQIEMSGMIYEVFLLPILLAVTILGLVLLTIISVIRFISGVRRVLQSVTTLQASMEAIKSQTREQDTHIKQLTDAMATAVQSIDDLKNATNTAGDDIAVLTRNFKQLGQKYNDFNGYVEDTFTDYAAHYNATIDGTESLSAGYKEQFEDIMEQLGSITHKLGTFQAERDETLTKIRDMNEWIAVLKLPPPPPPHCYNGPCSPSAPRRDYYEAEYYRQAGGYGSHRAYGPHYDHSNRATPGYDVHRC